MYYCMYSYPGGYNYGLLSSRDVYNWFPVVKQMMDNGRDLDQFIDQLKSGLPVNYTVNKTLKIWNGQLIFFTDSQGHKFILKQIDPKATPWDQYSLVLEAVGSGIAEEMNIPNNRVRIIPPNLEFNLKPFSGYPATLHTLVEGQTGRPVGIQQKAGNKVPLEDTGLTYSVIQNMSKNPDLQTIAALDTFMGNADRHDNNLFYKDGHYVGIDMGDSLIHVLAKYAIRQLQTIQRERIQLTPEEKAGLQNYANTLQHLLQNCPVDKVVEYLDLATALSGLRELGPEHYKADNEKYFKRIARENIGLIPELLTTINGILIEVPIIEVPLPIPPSPLFHTVKPGETLWAISRMYELTIPEIVAANQLINPDIIHTGQRLIIPRFSQNA